MADEVEHYCGRDFEGGGAEREGEDGAEVVFVLGGFAGFDCVVAGVVRARCDFVDVDLV